MSSYLENNMNQIFVQFCKNDVDELSEHLTSQVNQGVLPEFMPRLAKERLELDECICGAPISSNPPLLEKFEILQPFSLNFFRRVLRCSWFAVSPTIPSGKHF